MSLVFASEATHPAVDPCMQVRSQFVTEQPFYNPSLLNLMSPIFPFGAMSCGCCSLLNFAVCVTSAIPDGAGCSGDGTDGRGADRCGRRCAAQRALSGKLFQRRSVAPFREADPRRRSSRLSPRSSALVDQRSSAASAGDQRQLPSPQPTLCTANPFSLRLRKSQTPDTW